MLVSRGESGRGQFQPKAAASPRLRLNPRLPCHAIDRLADDGETDARPLIFMGGVQSLKHFENSLLRFRLNPNYGWIGTPPPTRKATDTVAARLSA